MHSTSQLIQQLSPDDPGSSRPETADVLREALDLAELGLPVIPLYPRSKVPRIRRWQERGTTDTDTILGWFKGRPDDNLGLLTGKGIVALDLDAGGFESYARLTEKWGQFPETATAETGSGGKHILLRVSRPVRNRVRVLDGVDIRGDGGQIVVAPSIHPETGKPYVWVRHPREGIAEAPDWFVRWLAEIETNGRSSQSSHAVSKASVPARTRGKTSTAVAMIAQSPVPGLEDHRIRTEELPKVIALTLVGDRAALATAMIARFPVPDYGHRHVEMNRAVGSLIGGGFEPDLVAAVMGDWHAHFHGQGVIRTGPDEAAQEVDACIRSTIRALERGTFRSATSTLNHETLCHQIQLDGRQRKLLASGIIDTDSQGQKTLLLGPGHGRQIPTPIQQPYCKRVTQIGIRLCNSDDERAFVEALVVLTTYKILHTREYSDEAVIRMTHDQIRQIASNRREGLEWGHQQVERLKCKYVTREADGKPASRFELLREVLKGERKRSHPRGRPSEYQPTGVLRLLTPPRV